MTRNDLFFSNLVAKGYTLSSRQMTIINGKRIFRLTSSLDFDADDLLKTFRSNGLSVDDFDVQQQGNGIYQNYQIKVTVTT
ncbi:hypothetical protein [Spirosoma arcticum]